MDEHHYSTRYKNCHYIDAKPVQVELGVKKLE